MRSLLGMLLSLAFLTGIAGASNAPGSGTLTIVMDFDGPYSSTSLKAMKDEIQGIVKDSGLRLDWRLRAETANSSYDNLVVVRFKGKCILEPVGYLYDERGPLAFTHVADGDVLPFSEVECDHVTGLVRGAMFGGDYAHADQLLGRALGRVVAHELVHILTKSHEHGKEGVEKTSLSGRQLISANLKLSADDMRRLQAKLAE